jgi:hypothetical protein
MVCRIHLGAPSTARLNSLRSAVKIERRRSAQFASKLSRKISGEPRYTDVGNAVKGFLAGLIRAVRHSAQGVSVLATRRSLTLESAASEYRLPLPPGWSFQE